MRGGPVRGFWVRCMEEKNKRQDKVVAITVTYNRTRTLERCLSALESQSRPVDKIIIVDNNSSEEEKLRLRELVSGKQQVEVLWLPENAGGAGGFEAGMREARSMDPDWYWLMDDDAYPREDCLKTLLDYGNTLPNAGGVCPLIYGIDLNDYQWFHHKKILGLTLKNRPVVRRYEDLPEVLEEDANAFVGPLFSQKAVETAGIADGSLFIYGDDSEYTYRVSRTYKLYLIKNAVIDHQDAPVTNANMSPKGWWKEYYCNRNQFLLIREFHKSTVVQYLAYTIFSIRLLALILKSKMKGYHKLRSQLIIRAMQDGIRNRRGKVVDPIAYLKYLEERQIN